MGSDSPQVVDYLRFAAARALVAQTQFQALAHDNAAMAPGEPVVVAASQLSSPLISG